MGNDTESRQNHDVNFRMPEKPEQVLEQNGVTTKCWIEEAGTQRPVKQEHGDCTTQYWHRQQKEKRGDEHCPNKQGHAMQGHPWRPHVQDGGNKIGRAQNRACASNVQGENCVSDTIYVDRVTVAT